MMHAWVKPKWFWQTQYFFGYFSELNYACQFWQLCYQLSKMKVGGITYFSDICLFLSANWFIFLCFTGCDIPVPSDTKLFLDCTKSLLGKSLSCHINVFLNAYDILSVSRDCFGWISVVDKLWISYAVSVSLKQHCFWVFFFFFTLGGINYSLYYFWLYLNSSWKNPYWSS